MLFKIKIWNKNSNVKYRVRFESDHRTNMLFEIKIWNIFFQTKTLNIE